MLMVIFIKENGWRIRRVDVALIHIRMGLNMLGIGRMISRMDMESKSGLMDQSMRDNTRMALKPARASSNLSIKAIIKANFLTMRSTAKASMSGTRIDSIKVNGNIIECTAKVKLFGSTGAAIKDSISMIRNMALAHSYGQMEEDISDIGKMVNNMDGENITYKMVRRKSASGFKAKRLNGFRKLHQKKIDNIKLIIFYL